MQTASQHEGELAALPEGGGEIGLAEHERITAGFTGHPVLVRFPMAASGRYEAE